MFTCIGVGVLIFHKSAEVIAMNLVEWLHVDPEGRHVAKLLKWVGLVPHHAALISGVSLFYATVFALEGVGLLMEKRWAEYLTAIATASLIPFEVYETIHRWGVGKALLVVGNTAIALYLFRLLYPAKSPNVPSKLPVAAMPENLAVTRES